MKKVLYFIFIFVMLLIPTSCELIGGSVIVGITINSADNARTIKEGETLQLTAVVYYEKASQEVIWSSDNIEVATVDETGLVTGVKAGNVIITATSKVKETVSQTFALIVEEGEEQVVAPTAVKLTANDNKTTCKVGETITLNATVEPAEASQSIVWTSSDETIAKVAKGVVTPYKEGTVEITATARNTEISAKISLTFEKGEGPVVSGDWASMPYTTHAVFVSCENETKIKVKGVVSLANEKNGKVNYFVQNGTDGYYVYGQPTTLAPIEVGKVYELGGYKKNYNGLCEIVDVEYVTLLEEEITYTITDIGTSNPNDASIADTYHCGYVKGKGVLTSASVATKAYNFTGKVNGYDTTFRVDPAYMSADEFTAISNIISNAIGSVEFEFTGIMSAYGYGGKATPQIFIVNSKDIKFEKSSDAAIATVAKDKLVISSAVKFGVNEIQLPATIEGLDGVSISWASNNSAINVETGVVTHSEVDVTVELTATITVGEATETKKFNVTVLAEDKSTYQVIATLDCEDASTDNNWGNSLTKPSYNMSEINNTVTLGGHSWMLKNALISSTSNDLFDGIYGIRAQAGASADATARIEIQEDLETKAVEFDAAVYGSDAAGIQIRVEYSLDSGASWLVAETITIESSDLETFRVKLPEAADRVALVVVENSGRRVNIDNIKLMK